MKKTSKTNHLPLLRYPTVNCMLLLKQKSKKSKYSIAALYCFVFLFSGSLFAQSNNQENPILTDSNSVVLHADPRLAMLTKYREPLKNNNYNNGGGSIHSAKGYRVIIYSGTDRAKATATKADFMRRFPGTRVYLSYALPQYRVKAGDYATRQEAQEFYRQLSNLYSPCMVVPDLVEINTFRRND